MTLRLLLQLDFLVGEALLRCCWCLAERRRSFSCMTILISSLRMLSLSRWASRISASEGAARPGDSRASAVVGGDELPALLLLPMLLLLEMMLWESSSEEGWSQR